MLYVPHPTILFDVSDNHGSTMRVGIAKCSLEKLGGQDGYFTYAVQMRGRDIVLKSGTRTAGSADPLIQQHKM